MKTILYPLLAALLPLSPLAAAKPNIVLFLVDDMGWRDCGAYGSQYYETPNIDAFAKTAMRFTDAYAQPLCSPTRACILTGKHAPRHGILSPSGHQPPQPAGFNFRPESGPPGVPFLHPVSKNYLDLGEYTLAEALRDAGYRTAHIGKWHLGLTPEYWPDRQGFDVTFHCAPDPGPPGGYFSPYEVNQEGVPKGRARAGNITDGPEGEYIVDRQAEEAAKFIRASKDGPFFLNLWCYGVHGPWGHKAEYTAEFAQKTDPRGVQKNPIMASMLRSVDECFGRLLKELEAQGVADNTIVIFYSDNGGNVHSNVPGTGKTAAAEKHKSEFLADWRKWAGDEPPTNNHPLREGKGKLYEGGVRVPMMWAWAGRITPGSVTNALAGHIDIYPTLLDLAGLPQPERQRFDGISLAPLLTGKTDQLGRDAFFNYFPYRPNGGGVTVRSGDFKLIRWFDPAFPRELYNLKDDLGETANLAEQMPDKVKELDALIDAYLKDTDAYIPKPNPAHNPRPANAPAVAGRTPGGWAPKGCVAEVKDGALVVSGVNRNPFLARAGLKLQGPVTVVVKTRGESGPAKAQWRTLEQEAFPAEGQVQEFTLQEGIATVALDVPSLAHLRLLLPAQSSVQIESIELRPGTGVPHVTTFSK